MDGIFGHSYLDPTEAWRPVSETDFLPFGQLLPVNYCGSWLKIGRRATSINSVGNVSTFWAKALTAGKQSFSNVANQEKSPYDSLMSPYFLPAR